MIMDILVLRWIADVRASFENEALQLGTAIMNDCFPKESMGLLYFNDAVEIFERRMDTIAETSYFSQMSHSTNVELDLLRQEIEIVGREIGAL